MAQQASSWLRSFRLQRARGVLFLISATSVAIVLILGDFLLEEAGSKLERVDHGQICGTADSGNTSHPTWASCRVGRAAPERRNGSESKKLILFWNKFETFSYYGFRGDQFDFGAICGRDRCRTSASRSTFRRADAVIFTVKDVLSWRAFPKDGSAARSDVVGYPRRAHAAQAFVLFHIEAPARFRRLPWRRFNRVFNLTYTYISHPDTDIWAPYGRIVPRPTNEPYDPLGAEFVQNKTELVAWVVSNCRPTNVRNEYVRALRRHVAVDVYGLCGTKKLNCSFKRDGCFDDIGRRYYFFLAFENSHCEQYVTEKMYRALTMDLVPVVMGGADYRSLFPSRSYIDAKDFNSPRELAAFLLKLANDTDEYLSYFDWKKTLLSDNVHDAAHNLGLCKLCDILHDPHYKYKSPHFDYGKYYSPEKYCLPLRRQRHLYGLR